MNKTQNSATDIAANEDVIRKLDPASIRLSENPNRDESHFKSNEFFNLQASVALSRGNTVPIRVHRIPDSEGKPQQYEIEYGLCRLRCCTELGIDVLAVVSSTELTDRVRLIQQVHENSCRADFYPVDLGRIYIDALERKLVFNQAEFASACGRDAGLLSKAIKLASLPPVIIDLFDQVADIQYRFAKPFWDAYTGPRRERFLKAAEQAAQLPRPRNPDDIFDILMGKNQAPKPTEAKALEPFKPAVEVVLRFKGKPTGHVILGEDGLVDITLSRKFETQSCEALATALQVFLDDSGGKRSAIKTNQPKVAVAKVNKSIADQSSKNPLKPQLDLNLSDPNDGMDAEVVEVQS